MTNLMQHSLYLTVTALFLLLFKRIFKKKLSAKRQVLIWGLLLIRFLVPSLPQSEISVFNAIPEPKTVIYRQAEPEGFTQTGASSETQIPLSDVMPKETPEKLSFDALVVPLWLAGAVTLLAYFILVYAITMRRIRKLPEITDSDTLSLLEECREILQIKQRVTLCRENTTPMLLGIWKPRILLPDGYTYEETKSVLLHELCHLKNRDIPILWLGVLLLCLQWFNPVIWYSFFVLRRDLEVYCDERVLSYTENKKEYAALLLKTALRKNRFLIGTTSLQNGEKEVQRRIRYLAQFKKPKVLWSVLLSVIALVITAVCLTNSSPDYTMDEAAYVQYINRPMGAIMAELDYADGKTAVFHYLNGLFVYDMEQDELLHRFDLSKFNCAPHSQGEVVLSVTVSQDGKTALLTNLGAKDQINHLDSYLIDLKSGKVKETKQTALLDSITKKDTESLVPYGEGWIADRCIVQGETIYYLSYSKGNVDNIHLNKRTGDVKEEYYPFHTKLTSIPGNHFHFWSPSSTYFTADYPGYDEMLSQEKTLGVAEAVYISNLEHRSQINNHGEDTTIDSLPGYDYAIYKATETQGNPAASGNRETHKLTMYFLEYPTKPDTYAVLFFETGRFREEETNMMLESFTFTPVAELISQTVHNHLKPGESVMVNSGMAWHIMFSENDLPEIEKLIRLSGYDPDFSIERMDQRQIFDKAQFVDKKLYFYMLEIEAKNGTTYPKLYIFNYDTAELLFSSPYSKERGQAAQRLFILMNQFFTSPVKSALYVVTEQYLATEHVNAFSPYYQALSREIENWQESGNEATFFYHTTEQYWNRDPDKVDYIVKEKEAGNLEQYEILKESYLKPIESTYQFKIVWNGTTPTLYHNSAPTGTEWTPIQMTDFVGDMPR